MTRDTMVLFQQVRDWRGVAVYGQQRIGAALCCWALEVLSMHAAARRGRQCSKRRLDLGEQLI